jgi:MYXO-CTERM domain-containing protein
MLLSRFPSILTPMLLALLLAVGCRDVGSHASGRWALSGDGAAEAGTAGCDDNDPDTVDIDHPTLGCCHRTTKDWDGNPTGACPGPGCDPVTTAEIAICGDLELDTTTDMVWSAAQMMAAGDLAAHCSGLTAGGLSGWKVPTVNEARTLFTKCAPVLPGGSCQLQDPTCLDQGAACPCGSCIGGAPSYGAVLIGTARYYCKPGFTGCQKFGWTGSDCTNCGTTPAKRWSYQFINGAIVAMDVADLLDGRCYIQLAADGASCTAPQDCASGYCVGGVCCESACAGGTCPGGTCVPAPDAAMPEAGTPDLLLPDGPAADGTAPPDAGGGGDTTGAPPTDDSGCDCRVGGSGRGGLLALGLAALALVLRRRRRRRRR